VGLGDVEGDHGGGGDVVVWIGVRDVVVCIGCEVDESGVAMGRPADVIYTGRGFRARARGSKTLLGGEPKGNCTARASWACLELSSTLQLTAVSGSCGPRTGQTWSTWLGRAFR
jgi:hypothetical protein